jgi:hypothetical protein
MPQMHGHGPSDDEEYIREGGVLVPRFGGHEVASGGAPDDFVEEPLDDDGVPGTPDDLPYDLGVELPAAADQLVESPDRRSGAFSGLGHTGADEDVTEEPPLGGPDERELWHKQRGLIQESGDEAARWRALPDDDVPRVEDAIGEDAGEALPDSPEGESATGAT